MKIYHLINLHPDTQQIIDSISVSIITFTLFKSIPPAKKVTADTPKRTWETEISTFDQ